MNPIQAVSEASLATAYGIIAPIKCFVAIVKNSLEITPKNTASNFSHLKRMDDRRVCQIAPVNIPPQNGADGKA